MEEDSLMAPSSSSDPKMMPFNPKRKAYSCTKKFASLSILLYSNKNDRPRIIKYEEIEQHEIERPQ